MLQNATVNRRFVLNAGPHGAPTTEDLRIERPPMPPPTK
jgi:hypothetical protein